MRGIKIISLIAIICSFHLSSQSQICNLSLSTYSMNFTSSGGSKNITVYSNCKVIQNILDPWVTMTLLSSGTGYKTYRITVGLYTGVTSRTETINFSTLSIIKPGDPILKVEESDIQLKNESNTNVVGSTQKAIGEIGSETVSLRITQTGQVCPNYYTVSGDATYCDDGYWTDVTLSGYESGVSYKLYKNGVSTTKSYRVENGKLNWEVESSGVYTVYATRSGCTRKMYGDADVTFIPLPYISGTTSNSRCGSGTVTLGASASAGTVRWYTSSSGGSAIHSGTSFTTPTLSGTKSYYVEAVYKGCTRKSRTKVTATIKPIPTITGTTSRSRCGTGAITLSATASAGTVYWYASSTGGSAVGSGTNFTTPSLSSSKTYYVSATNNSCTTPTRSAVIATIKPVPTITSQADDDRCDPGVVNLAATASGGTINWYAASTGGSPIHSGTTYSPNLSATTAFYVDAILNSCTTVSRTAVTGNIYTTPEITSTTSNSRCGNGTVPLGATASAGTLYWYTTPTGGTSVGTSSSYTTPILSATTPYFVETKLGNCTSDRSEVIATVNPAPAEYNITPVSGMLTGPGIIGLESTQAGVTYTLYRDGGIVATTPISNNGDPLNFGEQSQEGVYTIQGTLTPCTVTMPGNVSLSIYALFIDATRVKSGSTCLYSGVSVNEPFESNSVYNFYPEALPYTANLSIQNGSSTENIQFNIDEDATISNVFVEKSGQYIALNNKYYKLLKDENGQDRILQLGPQKYQSQIQLGGLNGIVYDNLGGDFSLVSPTNVTGSLEIFDEQDQPVTGGITGFSWDGTDGTNPVPNGTYKYRITIDQDSEPAIVINGHLIKKW